MITSNPSAKAKAAGAPVKANISKLEPGQQMTVAWRGKPVWILRRTEEILSNIKKLNAVVDDPESAKSEQPSYVKGIARSQKPEYLVIVGLCTHLGCSPKYRPEIAVADLGADWLGGYFCPCHGSKYDLSGRVYKSQPAPLNLPIPPHKYLDDTHLLIGVDEEKA